jgi:pilus assembly protein Flp/PilA
MLTRFVRDCSGVSSAEYAIILAILGSGIAGAAFTLGTAEADAITRAAGIVVASADLTGSGDSGGVASRGGSAGASGNGQANGNSGGSGNSGNGLTRRNTAPV